MRQQQQKMHLLDAISLEGFSVKGFRNKFIKQHGFSEKKLYILSKVLVLFPIFTLSKKGVTSTFIL